MGEPSAVAPWPERNSSHLLVNSAQMAALEEQLFASGLPVGGDLEYADELTLGRAIEGRRNVD